MILTPPKATRTFAAHSLVAALAMAAFVLCAGGAQAAKPNGQARRVSELLISNGLAVLDKSKFEDARKVFEEAVVADPSNAAAFSYLGYAHYKMGDTKLAKKYIATALDIDPNELHALNWGGQIDLAATDLEGAEAKLMRLSRVCGTGCSEYKLLSDAVSTYKTKAN